MGLLHMRCGTCINTHTHIQIHTEFFYVKKISYFEAHVVLYNNFVAQFKLLTFLL